ncbi:MAG: phosphate acyltransferase PlsX [Clostridia bacterium]|nr:phosphate acyltransferase PlsX [Clostridia bacterium]
MKIAIDAMGGDKAPYEIVKGVYQAANEYTDVQFVLIGDEVAIKDCSNEFETLSNITIIHTDCYVTMDDDPMVVMKEKKDSSMSIGLQMLKEGSVDGFLSAGSTGALHTASTLVVRKIKGIRRSAIATIIPFESPILMLDSGANPTVTADILEQWAILGSVYMSKMLNIENVRVGLLNNGTEECKGTPEVQNAYQLLKKNKNINFVGNIESKELPNSPCDVLVTDGFTGNIALKLLEGMAKFFFGSLKKVYSSNTKTKLSYLMIKKDLKSLKNSFDSSKYGGAPLLGIAKPVIKAHGSSDAVDIKNAIRQTIEYIDSNIIEKVAEAL